MYLSRRNLNTAFSVYQRLKANIEPYLISHDLNSFPTILKGVPDKRRPSSFLFVNLPGEFIAMASRREKFVSFRNSSTLIQEKRLEIKDQLREIIVGRYVPFMVTFTDPGVHVWVIEWDID